MLTINIYYSKFFKWLCQKDFSNTFNIGYLSSINKKLLISSNKEKKENDFADSKEQPKTLYELTLIPY